MHQHSSIHLRAEQLYLRHLQPLSLRGVHEHPLAARGHLLLCSGVTSHAQLVDEVVEYQQR